MVIKLVLPLFLFFSTALNAQLTIAAVLDELNQNTVEYISVEELVGQPKPVLLDARERDEYEVSHLKNALWVGYDDFDMDVVLKAVPVKTTPIAVYCSVGVRSEDIGEKLKAAGYTEVQNLYGGIFEWKNKGFPVYDQQQQSTENVHAFSKYWGQLLTNARKVYNIKEISLEKKQ